jgi:hypothetical protein
MTDLEGGIFKTAGPWLAIGTVVITGLSAAFLVNTIEVVSELPADAQTPIEYVVNEAVARFGLPVVALLFLSAATTLAGHNGGKTRARWELWSKTFAFGAACFSLAAGITSILTLM